MCSHIICMKISSIFLIYLVLVLCQVQNEIASSSQSCSEIHCSVPSEEFNCKLTKKRSHKIEERLGSLKDCCPIYYCDDGVDEFLYVGIRNKTDVHAKSGLSDGESDEACGTITCPSNTNDSCAVETHLDNAIMEFAKDKVACCPVWKCTNDNSVVTKFSVVEGVLPPADVLETASSECTDIKCTDNPEIKDTVCSKQNNKSAVEIGATVGKLKECCSIWECKYAGGSIYNLFQVQGNSFQYKEIQRNQTITSKEKDVGAVVLMEGSQEQAHHMDKNIDVVIDMDGPTTPVPPTKPKNVKSHKSPKSKAKPQKPHNTINTQKEKAVKTASDPEATPKPKPRKSKKSSTTIKPSSSANKPKVPGEPPTSQTKMLQCDSGDYCPRFTVTDTCSYENSEETRNKFIPEQQKCCPLLLCNDENGLNRTHYVKFTGRIPTNPSDIEKEKGEPDGSKKCGQIVCKESSIMPNSTDCSSRSKERPIIPKIIPFASCCDMLKCYKEDGSYSMELGMDGPSFSYFEISFHDIPSEDIDRGEEAQNDDEKEVIDEKITKSFPSTKKKSYSKTHVSSSKWKTKPQ